MFDTWAVEEMKIKPQWIITTPTKQKNKDKNKLTTPNMDEDVGISYILLVGM